ncbi:hypothetical protein L198_07396 [Cryptococcus wingfieldii CBS 7118]|uniref:Uncharacterized protein n=1 Tax=Cryptococcus wingfieldii CBS 7118 TaxID=1295528 RepID=A0A1E3IBX5_9TREE|nr:hypothetical protein L198_07396 [Cryptococcus wingfieldii CBS 7118]ODN86103.1 hypothetical protein L198_07396 [Cryptococcus wingfieldii CBS 7118]
MSVHEPSSDLEQRLEEEEVAPPPAPGATERFRVPEEATRIVTNYMDSSTYKEHKSRDPTYTAIGPAVQGGLVSGKRSDTKSHVQMVQGDRWTKVEGTLFGAGWSVGEGTLLEGNLMIDPGVAMELSDLESLEDVRKEAAWYMPPPEDE